MGRFVVVVGAQWGDEGKGKVVDLLTERVAGVARFQGGHNAGPYARHRRREDRLSLIPSGILRERVRCFIGNGVVVSLDALLSEADMLTARGVPVFERLAVSPHCPLVLPSHALIDRARERASGRPQDRHDGPRHRARPTRTRSRAAPCASATWPMRGTSSRGSRELLDYHNFLLEKRFSEAPVDFQQDARRPASRRASASGRWSATSRASCMSCARAARTCCSKARRARCSTSTTAPIRSSPRPIRWPAYASVGHGPRPARHRRRARHREGLHDARRRRPVPDRARRRGRPSTCRAWARSSARSPAGRDAAAGSTPSRSRRSIVNNGITGLCVTKLDVLDGLDEVKLCTAYDDGRPRYETMPGWKERTAGLRTLEDLPATARAYLARLESVCAVPVTMISTGAERDDMIVSRHPFG